MILLLSLVAAMEWMSLDGYDSVRAAAQTSKPGQTQKGDAGNKSGMPKGYEKIVAVTLEGNPVSKEPSRLKPPRTEEVEGSQVDGSLVRELARQGLLIAAEEELRLATLDRCIGEVIPVGNESKGPFTVNTVVIRKRPAKGDPPGTLTKCEMTITITRSEPGGQPFLWTAPVLNLPGNEFLEPLVEQVEEMSRASFVEALQKAGYAKATPAKGTAPRVKLEDRLDFVSQFSMIRSLHSQMRAGETPEILGGLIRAYANLGSLTDFHWSPASKAFKARALLYAQRLVSKHGQSPFALAHRAYALALTGRHGAALEAIKATREATGNAAPEWLGLIDAYCAYKPATLEQVKGVDQELALYLRMRMFDTDDENEQQRGVEAIQKFLKVNPASSRAVEMLAAIPELGPQRMATEVGFNETWPNVYQRLAAVPNLPAAAKKVADAAKGRRPDAKSEYPKRKELMGHLQAAAGLKDQPGPSWGALADLLKEVSFTQAWRILSVETNMLGINADPSRLQLKPVVQGHRFEKFLDSFANDRGKSLPALFSFAAAVDVTALEVSTLPLAVEVLNRLGQDNGDKVGRIIRTNADSIYEDAARERTWIFAQHERNLIAISPHWPASIADAIERDPKAPLAEWEEKYGDSPTILTALCSKHRTMRRPTDAVRCLKKVIAISPSCSSYFNLAQLYDGLGDDALWLDAMQQVLNFPSLGLEHSNAHASLANWFMTQGEWEKAKPHATQAALSYSGNGLTVGSRYAEGVEDWAKAEEYQQQISERYQDSGTSWYFWCVRTGRGNVEKAKALAERYWNSLPSPMNRDQLWRWAVGQILADNHAQARSALRELFIQHRDVLAGVYAAVLADEAGDTAARDELFREVEKQWSSKIQFPELTNYFRGVLSGQEQGRWNQSAFEMLVLDSDESSILFLYLVAGRFLGNHGQKELSQEYLQCPATAFYVDQLSVILAVDALRKQNITIGKTRLNNPPDAITPLFKSVQALRYRKLDEAEALQTELLKRRADCAPALLVRAIVHEFRAKYAEAIADLEAAIRIDPNFYHAHNNLARLLSTCRKDEIRNGKKALEHAERAASLRQFETWVSVSALAAAHAECGQFDKAIELERRAHNLPGYDGTTNARLTLYLSKKPYHDKPITPAQPAKQ